MKAMPDPPRVLKVQGWLKNGGTFLIGVALVGLVVIVGLLLREVSDANDLADAATEETNCFRELANDLSKLEGEIDNKGWLALLAELAGATDEQTLERASEIDFLVGEWEVAQARRDDAVNICNDKEK